MNLIFHKAPQEKVKRGQIWRVRRPGCGPTIANALLRQLPIQQFCDHIVDVWWHCIAKERVVCLEVAGALTTIVTCHSS
jgi:hypothetical protein